MESDPDKGEEIFDDAAFSAGESVYDVNLSLETWKTVGMWDLHACGLIIYIDAHELSYCLSGLYGLSGQCYRSWLDKCGVVFVSVPSTP